MNILGPHNDAQIVLFGGSRILGGVEVFNRRLIGLVEGEGAKVHAARLNSHLGVRNRLLAGLNFLRSSMLSLVYLWVRRPPTVVVSAANILDVLAAWAFARFTRRHDIILIAHFNASWAFWKKTWLLRLFQGASRRLRVFCVAPNQRAYFVSCGIRVDEAIFPNFINYRVGSTQVPIASNEERGRLLKALFVGRVVPEKRVDALAAFLARVADAAMPIELGIVGTCMGKHEKEILRQQTSDFRIVFHGPKSETDVSLALQDAMLFCSFSSSDTLPLNMLEAADHNLPILTIRNPVTEDIRDLVGEVLFVEEREPAQAVRDKIYATLSARKRDLSLDFVAKNNSLACDILGIEKNRIITSVRNNGSAS